MEKNIELRFEKRYPLNAPCRFWWRGTDGSLSFAAGRTLDISTRGVFVHSSVLPPLQQPVMIEVDLPRALPKSKRTASLHLTGQGILVRHEVNQSGFAAALSYCNLESAEPSGLSTKGSDEDAALS